MKFRDSIGVAKDQWFASSVGRFLYARCQATGFVPTKSAVGERESQIWSGAGCVGVGGHAPEPQDGEQDVSAQTVLFARRF